MIMISVTNLVISLKVQVPDIYIGTCLRLIMFIYGLMFVPVRAFICMYLS